MAYENLQFEVSNQVARITVQRPQVLNALNYKTMEELGDAFDRVREDAGVRVAILTGAGEKSFVAGADINELAQQTPVNSTRYSGFTREIFNRPARLGKPTIAAVNGFALGGGCELALACSVRIASRTARFGLPEVKLGIIPGAGGTQRLARLCGKGVALELILTGEIISAEEALRIGLVNRVVEPAELLPSAEALAGKIIANAPLAVQYGMEAVERGVEMPLDGGLALESTLFGLCCATEDKQEGTRAFIEKRPARFQGR
jgi:enoyl-CoA hydratase